MTCTLSISISSTAALMKYAPRSFGWKHWWTSGLFSSSPQNELFLSYEISLHCALQLHNLIKVKTWSLAKEDPVRNLCLQMFAFIVGCCTLSTFVDVLWVCACNIKIIPFSNEPKCLGIVTVVIIWVSHAASIKNLLCSSFNSLSVLDELSCQWH